jgi:2-iminobutanoate/2-iminopropanoate deaminase
MRHYQTIPGVRKPFARYAHAVLVETGADLLFCSGQLGIEPDDTIPADAGSQAALCFQAIRAILQECNMGIEHIVRINAYVTRREDLPAYMQARDQFIAERAEPPASTLMIVSGFSRPEFLVEVEVIAAKPAKT